MPEIKNATGAKGDSKPKLDAEDIDNTNEAGELEGTPLGSISSVGEANISNNAKGGGDGSLPGEAENVFVDERDIPALEAERKQREEDSKQEDDDKSVESVKTL
jgi:hypothetical protein